MRKLGLKIKILRLTKGLSQAELAARLGLKSSGVSISHWENGKLPRPHNLLKLAGVLEVEPSELAELWMADSLGEKDEMSSL